MKAIRAVDTWARAGVYYVRTEAMVLGFDISLQGEFDTDTPDTEYVLVVDDGGKPVSTCRIHVVDEDGSVYAKIERVATVSTARGIGAGRLAVEEAERWLLEKGIHKIVITSRDEAVGFYEKLGYTADYEKNCRELFPGKKEESAAPQSDELQEEKHDPGFVIVYMEKQI